MKALVLALTILAPLGAHAETLIACKAEGQGGLGRDLSITIASPDGILTPAARLTIAARGLRFQSYVAQVGEAVEQSESGVTVPLTTLNSAGNPDEQSAEARLELGLTAGALSGSGKLTLTKIPENDFILQPQYLLTGCHGQL